MWLVKIAPPQYYPIDDVAKMNSLEFHLNIKIHSKREIMITIYTKSTKKIDTARSTIELISCTITI